ncbi:hypothetical protein LCI18_000759 [Fusarium solani-melongenae]|uniref:Uncharacterized protein n=1 Tax=Fusarium solani subsp. cucurbitae TaxID=2747967 RepID=A0ACD3YLJ1_FUSSC|nr:hypothetical protein LCI18_000759 [Fusarium solani-melongenae]
MNAAALSAQAPFPLTVRDEKCGFEGNSDMYGLGIRLSIYMQWLSAFLWRTFYPQGLRPVSNTYLIFIFAIFVAILDLTAQARPTYAVEMLVLAYIIFGGFYVVLWDNFLEKETTLADRQTVSWLVREISGFSLCGAIAAYYFWFWLRGIHSDSFLPTPCGSYAFIYAKVPLYNRHVTNILSATFALFLYGVISQLVDMLRDLWAYVVGRGAPPPADEQRNKLRRWVGEYFEIFAPYLRIFALLGSILSIELTLYWNGVTDVYSVSTTGQLIPLVIGIFGLAQFPYAPVVDYIVKIARDWECIRQSEVEAGGVTVT